MSKQVAAIHDLSGLGRCSLTAAIPVLAALGIQACPVPTAVLSCQTGFSHYFSADGTAWIPAFVETWRSCDVRFDGIFTGFLGGETQAEEVEQFLAAFRTPQTLLVVDPVLGDNGEMYKGCTAALCRRMAALAAKADVITPNLTEACLLSGVPYAPFQAGAQADDYPERVHDLAARLADGQRQVVVTGVEHKGYIYNIAAGREEFMVTTPRREGHFSGTGDLFSAVVCGCCVRGMTLQQGVELAVRLIQAALDDTHNPPEYGVEFERHLHLLTAL